MTTKLKRRWYQFGLKEMFVVLTLAGVSLMWLAYERNEARNRDAAIAAIEKLGGEVEFDDALPFRPKWLRPLLGLQSTGEVVGVAFGPNEVTDKDLKCLEGLTKLVWLTLDHNPEVTDSGMIHLAGLAKLDSLYITGTKVTSDGEQRLRKSVPRVRIFRFQ